MNILSLHRAGIRKAYNFLRPTGFLIKLSSFLGVRIYWTFVNHPTRIQKTWPVILLILQTLWSTKQKKLLSQKKTKTNWELNRQTCTWKLRQSDKQISKSKVLQRVLQPRKEIFTSEETTTSKIEDQLQQMQEQMTVITKKMGKSFNQIYSVKWELNAMKEKRKSYRNATGDVTPAMKTQVQLGIGARGFPESIATTADERMLEDVAAVDKLLKFMDIKDKTLNKISRIGKHDPKRETPRTFLFQTDSNLKKDFIINPSACLIRMKKEWKSMRNQYIWALSSMRRIPKKNMSVSWCAENSLTTLIFKLLSAALIPRNLDWTTSQSVKWTQWSETKRILWYHSNWWF